MAANSNAGGADAWLGALGATYLAHARELWDWYGGQAAPSAGAGTAAGSFEPPVDFARRFFLAAVPAAFAGPAGAPPTFPGAAPGSPPFGDLAAAGPVPALGLFREHQERWQDWADAGARLARAQAAYGAVLAPAGVRAAERLASRLAAEPPPRGPRELFDRWIDVAEAAWSELAHSAAYGAAFAELVGANVALQRTGRALVEQAARAWGLPTRAELDALHRALHERKRGAGPGERAP